MKHLLIYLLIGLVIFSFIGLYASEDSDNSQGLVIPAIVMAGNNGEGVEKTEQIPVGLIAGEARTMEDIHFRSTLENSLGPGFSLHVCEPGSSPGAQWEMFAKMVSEGCRMIFINLVDERDAERYADLALEQEVTLIFLHGELPTELLNKGPGLYSLGFSDENSLRAIAQQLSELWRSGRDVLDRFEDGVLAYSFLSDSSFEESGKAESFLSYLNLYGVEGTMARDSVTSYFSFDIRKEIDRIWVANTELIICTSSSDARKSLDYLNDPAEFAQNHIEMVLLVADESAKKMVEDGEALLAIGTDGQALGAAAINLMEVLADGGTPTAENIGVGQVSGRYIYVPNTMVRSSRMTNRPVVADNLEPWE